MLHEFPKGRAVRDGDLKTCTDERGRIFQSATTVRLETFPLLSLSTPVFQMFPGRRAFHHPSLGILRGGKRTFSDQEDVCYNPVSPYVLFAASIKLST